MVNLIARTPGEGLLPLEKGGLTLVEAMPEHITSIAPFQGQQKAASAALKDAHGMAFPKPGRVTGKAALRAVWTGMGQCFLIGGEAASATLAKHAALTDQSDGWAVMRLTGAESLAVMARLTPLDLRPSVFKRGATARSELQHMMVVISHIPHGVEIMVMRSFAQAAIHAIEEAMTSVAAQERS